MSNILCCWSLVMPNSVMIHGTSLLHGPEAGKIMPLVEDRFGFVYIISPGNGLCGRKSRGKDRSELQEHGECFTRKHRGTDQK
jgi:hypothetical protein